MGNNHLPTDYQNFIAVSRYARYIESEKRRETWSETVARYMDNVIEPVIDSSKSDENFDLAYEIEQAILGLDIMPSMRMMMTAGPALERDNICGYNCSYLVVDDPKAFDEAMHISMNGCGVGFSVERQYINKLPEVPDELFDSDTIILVKDSKEGWAKAFRMLVALLYAGEIPKWDVSRVRPAGSVLKTFGGRASGPAPLVDLFNRTVEIFKGAKGRKLNSLECHDIMTTVAQIVVSGGVRRSAMISLSNLSDNRMRYAKTGQFPDNRYLANNSVCYTEKPDAMSFLREWTALAESGTGERGIFNRQAAQRQAAKNGRRNPDYEFGCNPCSEIILRGPKIDKNGNPIHGTGGQFCNLSECVIRATDTKETLLNKVRLATILGTCQSRFTNFKYLRKIWRDNTEEERLLGVSLTGIMDNPLTNGNANDLSALLEELRQCAVDTNKEYAEKLGIPQSTATTCVKPSGTVSQLVDSASGIHPRHAPYYIRRVRGNNYDPLTQFMKDQGIPNEPCVYSGDTTTVFSFPVKAPEGAICTKDVSALDQLKMWETYQDHFAEHKPSITVNVKADEWFEVGAYVYEKFDKMSGVSFLPYDEHTYQQAPYEEIGKSDYKMLLELMPKSIDWAKLAEYEGQDFTKGSQTLACSGETCELVDIA